MSKYGNRLEEIEKSIFSINDEDIANLSTLLSNFINSPVVIIGSGGSLSVANFISLLHTEKTGNLSKHMTPQEFIKSKINRKYSAIILTASGRNKDIINVIKETIFRELQNILIISSNNDNLAKKISEKFPIVNFLSYKPLYKKDGFLAVNSIIAFSTLFLKAYMKLYSEPYTTVHLEMGIG